MSKTIAILSSARRNGNTAKFLELLQDHWPMDYIYLEDHDINGFDYQYRQQNDDFHRLMDRIVAYDNIIFAAPVYWYSVPPAMKAFLDRISDYLNREELKPKGRLLREKKAFVLSTSNSKVASRTFISMFEETFQHLGMRYQGFIHADCSEGFIPSREAYQCQEFAHTGNNLWKKLSQQLHGMYQSRAQ